MLLLKIIINKMQLGKELLMPDYWEENNIKKPIPFVVCAACKHPKLNLMLVGARHWDKVMTQQYKMLCWEAKDAVATFEWDQGFINQFGEFLTREEAMIAAKEFGQPIDIEHGCGGDEEILYSEGLY